MRKVSHSPPIAASRSLATLGLARGFTLVELLVTLAISSVIISAAVSGIVALNKQVISLERRAALHTEAKLLTEYFVSDLQAAGGGSFRPWSMIHVDNDFNDSGSDRIVLAEVDEDLGECAIVGRSGSGANFTMSHPADGVCCLSVPSTTAWSNRTVMAVNKNGSIVKIMKSNNANASSCKINFPPGHGGSVADELAKLPGDDTDFVDGAIAVVRIKKVYVDHTTHQLILEEDADSDGTLETHVIADGVYDLQAALGYDEDSDRTIRDTNDTADEFLFNHPSDEMGTGGLTEAKVTDLRMIQIGLIVGVRMQGSNGSAQTFDGPVRTATDTLLSATQGRAFLRNLSLYDQ